MNSKGRYLHHSEAKGFIYEYQCERCRRQFRSVAPELSLPILCHGCYIGDKRPPRKRNRRKS